MSLSRPLQTWMNWLSITFSIALFFTVALCYNASCPTCYTPSNPYWTMQRLLQDPLFYLLCVITPLVALLPRYTELDTLSAEYTSPLLKYLRPRATNYICTRCLSCLSREPGIHCWSRAGVCPDVWLCFYFPDISTGRVKARCFPARSKLEDIWINSLQKPAGTSSASAGSRWGRCSAPSLPSCPSLSPPLNFAIEKTRGASPAPRHPRGPFYKQSNRAGGARWGPQTLRGACQISILYFLQK